MFVFSFQPTALTDPMFNTEYIFNQLGRGVVTVWSVDSLMWVSMSAVTLNWHYQEPKKPALDPVRHKHKIWMKTMWDRERARAKYRRGVVRKQERKKEKCWCIVHTQTQTYTREPEESSAKPGNPTTNRFSWRKPQFEESYQRSRRIKSRISNCQNTVGKESCLN